MMFYEGFLLPNLYLYPLCLNDVCLQFSHLILILMKVLYARICPSNYNYYGCFPSMLAVLLFVSLSLDKENVE